MPALAGALLAGCATAPDRPEKPVFYPLHPEPPRLQYLTSFSSSRDVEEGMSTFDRFLFGKEPEEKLIRGPYGIAWHEPILYVCDVAQGVVLRLDLKERKFGAIGVQGAGALQKPINIAADERGYKYVADIQRARVVVFGPDDTHVATFGEPNQFRPTDVGIHGGDLYVCDISGNEIEVLNRDTGELERKIRTDPGQPGFLRKPTNIALDRQGNLYVVDTLDCHVLVFDAQAKLVRTIGEPGDVVGQFARPKGAAVDPRGFVYIVDAAFENCQIFTPDGEIALAFGGPGDAPGTMVLPTRVTISTTATKYFARYAAPGFQLEYVVFVVNQYGPRKVNVYGFGRSDQYTYPD